MVQKRLGKSIAWITGLSIIAVASLTVARVYRPKPGRPPQLTMTATASLDHVSTTTIPRLVRLFPDDSRPVQTFNGCIFASPQLVESQGEPFVVVASSDGTIAAIDPKTGVTAWSLQVPVPVEHLSHLVATPVRVGEKLVVAYQSFAGTAYQSHWVAVIDLEKRLVDEAYPAVELTAEKPMADGTGQVKFNPPTALPRAALVHGRTSDTTMGYVYVSFGNPGDIQPWHGWVFELDLDAWQAKGPLAAISAVLVTTPEATCPEEERSGMQDMICGGGVWTPAGPQIYPTVDSFELLVPTGNGQFDLQRQDYANTLMRLGPGLVFDPACDTHHCANFDPLRPDLACVESCKNLFIPRLLPDDPPLRPASGACDQKTFWECLAWLDYDLGANAPVKVEGLGDISVYVQPGKEGGVYLIDAQHMGRLYDRKQIVALCGTPEDPCWREWAGMMLTHPVLTTIDATPVVIIPTFMPDMTQPAGLVALKIVLTDGTPRFESFWQAPDATTPEATAHFRYHPSRAIIAPFGPEAYVWVVDVGWQREHGIVYGVRARDGAIVERVPMVGRGQPNIQPLLYENVLYMPSCYHDYSAAWLEAYAVTAAEDTGGESTQ